jgi:hypothetical protein
MKITVAAASRQLEGRGLLTRKRQDDSGRIIELVGGLIRRPLPSDLVEFYRENIWRLGQFHAETPMWNDYVGWHGSEAIVASLLHASAVPLFDDGCGNYFGLDMTDGVDVPAVYFFGHEDDYEKPTYAAGSSLGAFLLLLADHDRAIEEGWPDKWELGIDPDLEKCPRAPAIWAAD